MTEKKQRNWYAIFALMAIVLVFTISLASAEFWSCFKQGEIRHYCSNYKPPVTCENPNGCMFCDSRYDPVQDCYVHGNWNKCNQIEQTCSNVGGNTTFDITPPNMTILNPIQGERYNSANVNLNLQTDEPSYIYLMNLNDRTPRWTKLCSKCTTYSRVKRFNEGENTLKFKIQDVIGNTAYKNLSFFIDSKAPRIYKVAPTRGFSNGDFEIEFDEANPENLTLHYGTHTKQINLSNCIKDKRYTKCLTQVNLSEYNNQQVEYYFTLTDIASNEVQSRHYTLRVDNSAPILLNPDNFYHTNSRYLNLNMQINEPNFKKVYYTYMDRGRERAYTICSRLRNGVCEKKAYFKDGNHKINITIEDEAGNKFTKQISFFIDSKAPRIYKVAPTRGFSNGDFEIEFDEANPENLTLHYGNDNKGYEEKSLNISQNCEYNRGKYYCDTNLNLSRYSGEEINYFVKLRDIVNQSTQSRTYKIAVDTVFPKINNENLFSVMGKYVKFYLNITEENFKEALYSYLDHGRLRTRRLCSRLNNGICEYRAYFRNGEYNLTIQVNDKAGNSIATPISFSIGE